MAKFLLSLGLILIGLAIGQYIRIAVSKGTVPAKKTDRAIKWVQLSAMLVLNPIVTLGAFWRVKMDDSGYIALPILGFGAMAIGGLLGLLFSHLLKHDRAKTGAMFGSASFTNMGNFGGLVNFIFFGEISYVFVSLYKMLEEVFLYLIGFPIAKLYGTASSVPIDGQKLPIKERSRLARILLDPFIMVYFVAIGIGILLNLSGLERPDFFQPMSNLIIPVSSLFLVVSVGYRMRIKAIAHYKIECYIVALIKFLIIPICVSGTAYLLGIGNIANGIVLKVVIVMSAMPSAFNSLIPPQLYGLDSDLANSCWLFTTGSLVFVIPALYFITL